MSEATVIYALPERTPERDYTAIRLAAYVSEVWQRNRRAKEDHQKRMLRSLRQRLGEYEPDVLAAIQKMGGSDVYVQITDAKCRTMSAWILDILTQERPWDLEPSPIADLDPDIAFTLESAAMDDVEAAALEQAQSGVIASPNDLARIMTEAIEEAQAEALKGINREALVRAESHAKLIDDQLTEGGFADKLAEAIGEDFTTFGVAIIKAPVFRRKARLQYSMELDGQVQPEVIEDLIPTVDRVSPLDLYPSDDALTIQDGELIEIIRLSRRDLLAFRGVDGYSTEAIDSALEDYGRAGYDVYGYYDNERDALEGRETEGFGSGKNTLDVLCLHAHISGAMLQEFGVKKVDEWQEYPAEVWKLGKYVIYAQVSNDPLGERPYSVAKCFEIPGSFWAKGIPDLIADIQQQANAAARALANNMALASGPQVGIAGDKLTPGTDATKMWPWKIWAFESQHGSDGKPPVTFFQPEMKAAELMAIYEKYAAIADDVTGIPRYVAGNEMASGAARTASGLSMLLSAATKTIKNIVLNIDRGLIRPTVDRYVRINMLYWPDPSIKGDVNVQARGAVALLVKEQQQIRRNEFLQITNNPVDYEIMGPARRAELLRSAGKAMDLDPDDVAPSREEMEAQIADAEAQQAQQQPPTSPAIMPGMAPAGAEIGPDGQPVSGQDFALFQQGGAQ